ncbi:hypothetical protein [Salinarimonas soli]|uniref:Uncharacterized protein n=1 Tax=Salinarimonas soli TaxID=1638099 RepID=A0A5B2VFA0_9HYPH|nr:hypothetical protein [Salinarimonas soli]KAA2238243.1 hypothetical protein F0L46_06245 [Salinarimonas soli]
MRKFGLVALVLLGTGDVAFGQEQQVPPSPPGRGYFIWRNAVFMEEQPRRLQDGRAEAAMRAARENVLAFERLRAANAVPPLAVAQEDPPAPVAPAARPGRRR